MTIVASTKHQTKKGGVPMHDVTSNGIYPNDFYSHEGFRYYSDQGNKYDMGSHYAVTAVQGKPNKQVKIYRAVPKDAPKAKINAGDWVSHSRTYVHDHGMSNLGGKGNYKVLSKTVRANELFTDGNSIHEWGYDPQPRDKDHDDAIRAKQKARQDKFDAMSPDDKAAHQEKKKKDMEDRMTSHMAAQGFIRDGDGWKRHSDWRK